MSWGRSAFAVRYQVTVRVHKGLTERFRTRTTQLSVPDARPWRADTVTGTAVSSDGSPGPAAVLHIGPTRAAPKLFLPFSELTKKPKKTHKR